MRIGKECTQALFGRRTIHVGLGIGGPAMTPVFAFEDGIIHSFADNDEDGSYGPTIITEHQLVIEGNVVVWLPWSFLSPIVVSVSTWVLALTKATKSFHW